MSRMKVRWQSILGFGTLTPIYFLVFRLTQAHGWAPDFSYLATVIVLHERIQKFMAAAVKTGQVITERHTVRNRLVLWRARVTHFLERNHSAVNPSFSERLLLGQERLDARIRRQFGQFEARDAEWIRKLPPDSKYNLLHFLVREHLDKSTQRFEAAAGLKKTNKLSKTGPEELRQLEVKLEQARQWKAAAEKHLNERALPARIGIVDAKIAFYRANDSLKRLRERLDRRRIEIFGTEDLPKTAKEEQSHLAREIEAARCKFKRTRDALTTSYHELLISTKWMNGSPRMSMGSKLRKTLLEAVNEAGSSAASPRQCLELQSRLDQAIHAFVSYQHRDRHLPRRPRARHRR